MDPAKKEQNVGFVFPIISKNSKKSAVKLLNNHIKIPISLLRDPPRGPYFLCCPI